MAFGIEADLILVNGRIWRGRAEGISEALAVWQGKVLATGSNAEILGLKGAKGRLLTIGREGYYELNLTFGAATHRVLMPIERTVIIASTAEAEFGSGEEIER